MVGPNRLSRNDLTFKVAPSTIEKLEWVRDSYKRTVG
jgi:hypothetical protein